MQAVVGADGTLTAALPDGSVLRLRAAIGAGGVSGAKVEGDGATPLGPMALRRVLWRADRIVPPVCAVSRAPLAPSDGWCDDVGHADYNRLIRLPHEGSHERLWREDGLYDVIGLLGWNDAPVVAGRGSAIFLHVAEASYAPTAGCVALARDDLLRLLAAGLTGVTTRG